MVNLLLWLSYRSVLRITISIYTEDYHIELYWELPYRYVLRTTISIYSENYHIELYWGLPYRAILRTTISIYPENYHIDLSWGLSRTQPTALNTAQWCAAMKLARQWAVNICLQVVRFLLLLLSLVVVLVLLLLFWHPKLSLGNLAKQIEFISLISK